MANFRGSYIIAYTPFTEGGAAIDHKGLRRFIDWQIDEGTHGLIALGSFGQFLSITDEERTAIVESFVGQAAGRAPVIVGTMDARTENAVRYSKEAEVLGADGIMVAPPYYYTPTDDEIFAYYKEISEAVSIPVMLYNNPFTTNVDMSAALVARLTKAFENVRYIKESSGFADRIYDIERLTGGVMNSFAGSRVYESLLMGAAGYVSPPGSYAPRQSAQMWESLASGDLAGGKMLSDKFAELARTMRAGHPSYGNLCYNRELVRLAGYPIGDPRPPFFSLATLGKAGAERMAQITPLFEEIRSINLAKAAAE